MSGDIDQLRTEIDALDDELVGLLARRARLAQRIGELKGNAGAYRPEREAQVLRRVTGRAAAPLPPEAVDALAEEGAALAAFHADGSPVAGRRVRQSR